MTGPVLETERLILRPPAPGDGDDYAAFYMSERAQFVGGPLDERKSWYAFYSEIGHWGIRGYGSFAVTLKGSDRALGMIGPWFPHTWPEREIGWIVYSEAEGKGIAFEAAVAARAFAYDTLGWTTAVSYVDRPNARSIALAERMGCVLDDAAPTPDTDCVAYRHPAPEELQ